MASALRLVANDTPTINLFVYDATLGAAIDLSTALSVVLKFRKCGTTTVLASLTGTLLQGTFDPEGNLNPLLPATPGQGGRVAIYFPPGVLAVAPGNYEAELKLNLPGGAVSTAFDLIPIYIRQNVG